MQSLTKKILLCLAKLTIGIFIVFGSWAVGYKIGGNDEIWKIIAIVATSVYGFFLIANFIFATVIKRATGNIKAKDAHRLGDILMKKVQSDYGKARRNVGAVLAVAYLYVLLMMFCVALVCAAMANLIYKSETSFIMATVIGLLFNYPFADVFFGAAEITAPPAQFELDRNAFPLLYDTARAAAKKLGCNKPVRIFSAGTGVSVSLYRGSVVLCIDYVHSALLTRDELYNVLLHEVAHVVNKDSARGKTYARAEAMFSGGNDKFAQSIASFTTVIPMVIVALTVHTYDTLASRHHEIEADSVVAETGDKQVYVNALAKTRMISLFAAMPRRELDFDFYEPEKPTNDYAAQEVKLYDVYRAEYEDRWISVLEREIPARVDSHPTFKMRREAFGCEYYDADVKETDENFKAEREKIVEYVDNVMSVQNGPYYSLMRERNYVDVYKIMKDYDTAVESGAPVSEEKKLEALRTYYGIDKTKALAIADDVLSAQPDAPTANFVKGMILYFEFDDGCIECFERAGRSAQFADPALDIIGQYYLLTGKQTQIDEYRKNADELTQRAFDTERGARMSRKTVFVRSDMDKATETALIDRIRTETRLKVSKIYIAKFTDEVNNAHYPVLLVFKRISDPSLIADELNAAFSAIGSFSDKYDLIPCYGKTAVCKKITHTDGALRYDANAKIIRNA